ncbi:MAG: hypothetical protein ABIG20_03300 [archaeon]
MKRIILRDGEAEHFLDLGELCLEFNSEWELIGIEFSKGKCCI